MAVSSAAHFGPRLSAKHQPPTISTSVFHRVSGAVGERLFVTQLSTVETEQSILKASVPIPCHGGTRSLILLAVEGG